MLLFDYSHCTQIIVHNLLYKCPWLKSKYFKSQEKREWGGGEDWQKERKIERERQRERMKESKNERKKERKIPSKLPGKSTTSDL